ncbi:MAG TPA: hypothetical protein ENJ60_09200 [Aeromonadales bacterium]|nr:hypothetical protein [Aeromonadales bacterium]
MKNIEYYYNIFYYFFYTISIKFFNIIDYILCPIAKLFYYIVNRCPSIRKHYVTKEHDDPEEAAKHRLKTVTENPERSLGTMTGGGITISVLSFIFLGIWHLIRNYFFPSYQDTLVYSLIIIGLISYTVDNLLVTQQNQGPKYIRKFNKKKGWWRIKWAIITALSPIFAIWFAIITSSYGSAGQYILNLNGYTKSDINHLIYKKQLNMPVTDLDLNKTKQNEQELLNKIRKYTPDRAQ